MTSVALVGLKEISIFIKKARELWLSPFFLLKTYHRFYAHSVRVFDAKYMGRYFEFF